jgi:hypothetical protein
MIRAIFSFFIYINYFEKIYPDFMSVNIWDFLDLFFNEFLISIIIGYSKNKDENVHLKEKIFDPNSFDFRENENNINMNYNEKSELNKNLNNFS